MLFPCNCCGHGLWEVEPMSEDILCVILPLTQLSALNPNYFAHLTLELSQLPPYTPPATSLPITSTSGQPHAVPALVSIHAALPHLCSHRRACSSVSLTCAASSDRAPLSHSPVQPAATVLHCLTHLRSPQRSCSTVSLTCAAIDEPAPLSH